MIQERKKARFSFFGKSYKKRERFTIEADLLCALDAHEEVIRL